ncbi:hypothetical protein F4778DRAFT_719091 [Xylariomycetidae sp. FL2044]|nr:hypothetical protein F4778DRAFT_719091 [Xylariomycetidae sp. FL2044]
MCPLIHMTLLLISPPGPSSRADRWQSLDVLAIRTSDRKQIKHGVVNMRLTIWDVVDGSSKIVPVSMDAHDGIGISGYDSPSSWGILQFRAWRLVYCLKEMSLIYRHHSHQPSQNTLQP